MTDPTADNTIVPLNSKIAIVNADGTPTQFFQRWAQERSIDISQGITFEDLTTYLASIPLRAGSGITLTPDGNLAESPEISADLNALLDALGTTQGSIIFRGAVDWEILAPGTAGDFLKTLGAGADPMWAASGGGGGGAYSVFKSGNLSNVSEIDITGLDFTQYSYDLDLEVTETGTNNGYIWCQLGDTAAIPNWFTSTVFSSGYGSAGGSNTYTAPGTFGLCQTLNGAGTPNFMSMSRLRCGSTSFAFLASVASAFWEIGSTYDTTLPSLPGALKIGSNVGNFNARYTLYQIAKS